MRWDGLNFLFDKSQTPHLRADRLCELCGVSQQTAASKASAIGSALKIGVFNPEWLTPNMVEEHPLTWMLVVNGMPVDIRWMPRGAQEQAFRQGLIPYIPADREA